MCTTTVRLGCWAALLLWPYAWASAADWDHWRGPRRTGHTTEDSGWSSGGWPPKQPTWSARVGEGGASPLIIGGRVYAMGWHNGQDSVNCFDAKDGQELWQVSYACPQYGRRATGDEGIYSSPTSTPEYDSATGFLYTLSCDGDLKCLDTLQKGKEVWGFNLYARYDAPRRPRHQRSGLRDYGYTTAPLLVGDWVIVEVGDDEGNLMAFSKATGDRVWTSEYKGPAGHTGGLSPITIDNVPCVAVLAYEGVHVTRVDAASPGKLIAKYPWPTDFANNIATPAVQDDCVLITAAYNHNAICKIRITPGNATKLWEQPFASKVCSPIIDRGRIYWAWQRLRCLDWESGEQRWEGGEFADAGSCILTADQRLIVWGHHGRLALVESAARSPDGYKELAQLDHVFSTDVWPHVALSDGRLVCKDRAGNIKCFEIAGKKSP